MQAKLEVVAMTALPIPDVLKQLIYDPVALDDAQPVNTTEAKLATLIDDKLRLKSTGCVTKFLQTLQHAKTEANQALVLVILRATATGADDMIGEACTAAFEKCGGLKIAKKWLNEAVEWNYSDLLVLLLDVLKVLPVQLTSITEARINEPIVKLRKEAPEEKVRRAAQDLLKHWRSRFTEKEKAKTAGNTSPKGASSKTDSNKTSSSTPSMVTSTVPKSAAEAAVSEATALKKRPIKRLERLPFGGGNAAVPTNSASSKSSELIGNLMQRKSAKDATTSKAKKDSLPSDTNKQTPSSSSSESSSKPDGSTATGTGTPTSSTTTDEIAMQLPAIQSFKAVATTSTTAKKTKAIRWADEDGGELTKIKLIESWRDMIQYNPHQDESSFKDATLREHEAERQMMKDHKEREAFHVTMSHAWTTPALLQLPEPLANRRAPVMTAEAEAQSNRTRREMEFLVLDGEVPPVSPKEWTRTNEPHRGPPKSIPLLDADATAAAAASATQPSYGFPGETEEERALREALGPLERSTIALLMENEHMLPMIYDEAQRNGNRIADARVVEIIEYHRRQGFPPPHQMQMPPPSLHQRFAGSGGGGPPPPPQGFNKYGGGGGFNNSGPPPHHGPPVYGGPGYDYNRPPPFGHHHGGHKRKAPGDIGPPPKRMVKRGPNGAPLQCIYFTQPLGCKHGANCQYAHEMVPPMGHGGAEYGGGYGPPPGGRFGGHQPPMGMRGGGGMRGMMHGGR